MNGWVRILGIDPGSRRTGYGVIDTDGQQSRYVASGVLEVHRLARSAAPADRLRAIFSGVSELVECYAPHEMAVEQVFVARNPDSALKLGQARAAAICATFATNIVVSDYAAREVKLAVVGKGGATKDQVQHMVGVLLCLREKLAEDAADALGIALCHAHSRAAKTRLEEAGA
ncbi:MAG: crossover junction endodeoxyribonuclease RuvC [Gammaproteobacteria bacterium]|nr:crossover junction endodeoxyribonuclease RuvC [Gammaproteobacteria bacterium]